MSENVVDVITPDLIEKHGCVRCGCAFVVDLGSISPGLTMCGNNWCRFQFVVHEDPHDGVAATIPHFPRVTAQRQHFLIHPRGEQKAWIELSLGPCVLNEELEAKELRCLFCDQNFERYRSDRLRSGNMTYPIEQWTRRATRMFGDRHVEVRQNPNSTWSLHVYACHTCGEQQQLLNSLDSQIRHKQFTASFLENTIAELTPQLV